MITSIFPIFPNINLKGKFKLLIDDAFISISLISKYPDQIY